MPHILFKQDFTIKPHSQLSDGVFIDFIANGRFDQKIGIKKDDLEFLLLKKKTNDGYLLKYDKYSRISPVDHIKTAINQVAKSIPNNEIMFSNISSKTSKISPNEAFLKDIDFFINDFDFNGEICIEVGFGSGRHILYQAKTNPNILFIGLEIHSPSLEQMLKQVKIQNIKNILAINYDARLFLEFIKSNSISKIFVHFPVPWPKKPHRRVYSKEFVDEALRVLKLNGTLELRTDDEDYYMFCKDLLECSDTKFEIFKNKDLDISSKYEDRWKKQEKNIYDLIATSITESSTKESTYKFDFIPIDFKKLAQNFKQITVVEDDFFIHFEDLYIIDEYNGLLQVALGAKNKPESKYILIKDGVGSYYQSSPTPSKTNFKAHQKIMEIIK